jgi:membrane associated rhomboid family serine protease
MAVWDDLKSAWGRGGMLVRLIYVNVGVFAVLATLRLILLMGWGGELANFSRAEAMGLATTWQLDQLIFRPWTVLTHMFVHNDVWHIAMNMLLLWWMGSLFVSQFGARKLLSTYLLGGFAGWALYVVASNIFPGFQTARWAFGASAAVMAIFVAAAVREPERPVALILLGPVPLKYLAIGYVLLDYFALSNGDNTGGNLAHLGGAIYGFAFARQAMKGVEIGAGFERFLDWLLTFGAKKGSSTSRMHVVGGARQKGNFFHRRKARQAAAAAARPKSDEEFNAEKKAKAERLDVILDKISKRGYDSLTADEKRFLFDASNKG